MQAVSTGNQIFMSQFDFAAEGQGELPLLEGQVRKGGRRARGRGRVRVRKRRYRKEVREREGGEG